jgi:Type II secretion system protein C
MAKVTLRQAAIGIGMASVALSGFGFGWWQVDDDRRSLPAKPAATEWKPFKARTADLSADSQILLAKQPFGVAAQHPDTAAAAAKPAATAAPDWRVGGIVATARRRHLVLLIRQPGQNLDRTERREIGESLPDGSVVRAIEPTRVTVDREGTIITIRIFTQK